MSVMCFGFVIVSLIVMKICFADILMSCSRQG